MKTKIISSILIYCMLIQIPMNHIGCTSFYPPGEDDNLSDYIKSRNGILLKLKDQQEVVLLPNNYFYIDQSVEIIYGTGSQYNFRDRTLSDFNGIIEMNNVDSFKVIESDSIRFHFYWTKDHRKLSFEEDKIIKVKPDSGETIWLVQDRFQNKISKISGSDVADIEVLKTDWIGTSIALILGMGLIVGIWAYIAVKDVWD